MAIKIVFTGGGTAGHVTPNIALIEALKQENWSVEYIEETNVVQLGFIPGYGEVVEVGYNIYVD